MGGELMPEFMAAQESIYEILREGFAELERRRATEAAQDIAYGLCGPATSEELP